MTSYKKNLWPDILKKVQFELGSNYVRRFYGLSERRTGLMVRFGATTEPWTELRSGSEKFKFELWFRTELRHPYIISRGKKDTI